MEPGPPVPAFEPVKESPHPLIPADAGIQTLPNCTDFQWAKAGSPRPRGRTVQQSPPFGNSLTRSFAGKSLGRSWLEAGTSSNPESGTVPAQARDKSAPRLEHEVACRRLVRPQR